MPDTSSPDSAGVEPIIVREVPIELCQFVKFAGLTGTGGEAKHLIGAGQVRVNGVVEIRKRRKLAAGDVVSHGGRTAVVRLAP